MTDPPGLPEATGGIPSHVLPCIAPNPPSGQEDERRALRPRLLLRLGMPLNPPFAFGLGPGVPTTVSGRSRKEPWWLLNTRRELACLHARL